MYLYSINTIIYNVIMGIPSYFSHIVGVTEKL